MARGEAPSYSTGEVASLLGLPAARLRSWAAAGLLAPARGERGELRFSFPDLVLLRAAKGLEEADISPRRIRAALVRLRRQLPVGRPLSGVALSAVGTSIRAREGGDAWDAETGQRWLDFAAAGEGGEEARTLRLEPRRDADEWLRHAGELEADDPAAAEAGYRRVLELDPARAEAHLNLGRLLHERGDLANAEGHYRFALAARPEDATAAFNLGVVLEDLGRLEAASSAYREALGADPEHPEAHYNLAGVLQRLGRRAEALQHLKQYRDLVDR